MNQEVKFKTNYYTYYNRAVGVIKKEDKFLILNVDNASHYHIPGGHIEINEDSLTAVKREIKEELGYTVKNAKLFCIQENFYKKKDILHHGIEFYYTIYILENIQIVDKEIIENDRGKEKILKLRWVTRDELKKINLKPSTIKKLMIDDNIDNFIHLIQK